MKLRFLALALVAASLLVLGGCDDQPTAPLGDASELSIDVPEAGTLIEGSYVVVLKDRATLNKSMSNGEAKAVMHKNAVAVMEKNNIRFNAIDKVYSRALAGFSAKISAEEADILRKDERVDYVEQDQYVHIAGFGGGRVPPGPIPEVIPWGITRVGGAVNYTGSHVAWILDTGIDLDNADLNVDVGRSVSFIPDVGADDDNGHGTHVSGTVAAIDNDINVVGVAAGATVVAVKVLDRRGSGSMTGVMAGVDYVAANGSAGDVANMSLTGGVYLALDQAVINASNGGIMFALAAGNAQDDANKYSPARANGANIYTVSCGNSADAWVYFSNYNNPPVDYNAPGYLILSLAPGGGTATMSGTSMSAPHVCGLLLSTGGNIHGDGFVSGDPDGTPDPIAHR